jgi:crotonobetainyl-CoA:carnitine CoA-transferase CaiB-like acyl-CoA transferase
MSEPSQNGVLDAVPLLEGVRVLDLCDERGLYAGRLLADLGAEVILVEPPGGSAVRALPPFVDPADPRSPSALWSNLCRSKKSVMLDLGVAHGRDQFCRLAASADILLESDDEGHLETVGLGAGTLLAANPRLVHVAISAFGRRGPKAGYQATDLTLWAASGALYPAGGGYTPARDGDRPPVRISCVPQAYIQAGADAAAGALLAYHARLRDGVGQRVEVDAQQALGFVTMGSWLAHLVGHPEPVPERVGGPPHSDMFKWAAKDGMATVWLSRCQRIWELMGELGYVAPSEPPPDLVALAGRYLQAALTAQDHAILRQLSAFVATLGSDELLSAATTYGLLLGPILELDQLAVSPHLANRNFWGQDGSRRYGRIPLLVDGQRCDSPCGGVPAVGEHDTEILSALPRAQAVVTESAAGAAPALDGLRVLDLSWVVAGPAISRVLADYGAVVIKVEPAPGRGADTARYLIPHHGGVAGPDRSLAFQTMNAGKLGIALDMRADASGVVERLVRWADVVVESFAPGVLDRLGLGYASLAQLNPSVILVSTSIMGQSGCYAQLKGTGQIAGALAGIEALTGWPDRPPIGMPNAYTDIAAPRIAIPALLAAMLRRARTGAGCHLDVSQMEAGLAFLGPALEACLAGAAVPRRAGNADAVMAPHGVYPARPTGGQHEAWVAVSARDEDDFAALAAVIGRPEFARDPRFASPGQRQANAGALDEAITNWTRAHPAAQAEELLQQAGVPAHAVLDSAGVVTDPQVVFRQQAVPVAHPAHGTTYVENSRYRLSRTPARIQRGAPMLDEHRELVLRELRLAARR